jgi:hypothetical protein
MYEGYDMKLQGISMLKIICLLSLTIVLLELEWRKSTLRSGVVCEARYIQI